MESRTMMAMLRWVVMLLMSARHCWAGKYGQGRGEVSSKPGATLHAAVAHRESRTLLC